MARPVTPTLVRDIVADVLGLDPSELMGRSLRTGPTAARHIAWYVSTRLTPATFAGLGELYGGRTKSTVYEGVMRVMHQLQTRDPWLTGAVSATMERVLEVSRR